MGPRGGIPDRWLDYCRVGKRIEGTRFIAFKVPLNESLCRNLPAEERFTPSDLIRSIPQLGFVIDLTNTARYYNPIVFRKDNIGYKKIYCQGHGRVPERAVLETFYNTVDDFLRDDSQKDRLLGVHCTHGLNRTGYLICKYMVDRLGFAPKNAIKTFEEARNHKIERKEYLREFEDTSLRRLSDNSLLSPPGSLGELLRTNERKVSLLPSPTTAMKQPLLPHPSYPHDSALLPRPQGGAKGLLPRPSRYDWGQPPIRDSGGSSLGRSYSYNDALLSRPTSDGLLPRPGSTKEALLPHPAISKEALLPRPHSTKEALLPRPHSTKVPLLPPPGLTKETLPRTNKVALLPSPTSNVGPALMTIPPKEPLLARPLLAQEPPRALLPSPAPSIGRGRAIFRNNRRDQREPLLGQAPVASIPLPISVSPCTAPLGLGRGRGRGRGRSLLEIDPPLPDEAPPRKTLLEEPFISASRRVKYEGGSGDAKPQRHESGRENSRDRHRRSDRDRSNSRESRGKSTRVNEDPMDNYDEVQAKSPGANGARAYVGLGRGYGRETATVYRRSHDFEPRMAGSGDSSRGAVRFSSTNYNRPHRN